LRQQQGKLGRGEKIATERGVKEFAVHDRIYFLRNEKSLGVKNGSLGTIEAIRENIIQVKLDGREQRVAVDTRFYKDLDYGYAATVYKAQGSTVDRSYLLATPHYDRHATYVALSRHREAAHLVYAAEDFGAVPEDSGQRQEIRARLFTALSRARPKELAHDYLEREASQRNSAVESTSDTHDRSVQSGRAAKLTGWAAIEEQRRRGVEDWLAMREAAKEQEAQLRSALDRAIAPVLSRDRTGRGLHSAAVPAWTEMLQAEPLEWQAQVLESLRDQLRGQRAARLAHTLQRVQQRVERRRRRVYALSQQEPPPPRGLLRRLQQARYEQQRRAWADSKAARERLWHQAQAQHERLFEASSHSALSTRINQSLQREVPALLERVNSYEHEQRQVAQELSLHQSRGQSLGRDLDLEP
jgi:PAS domain-containing protein